MSQGPMGGEEKQINHGTDGGKCRTSPYDRFNQGERILCTHRIGGTNKKLRVRECEVTDLFIVCNLSWYT